MSPTPQAVSSETKTAPPPAVAAPGSALLHPQDGNRLADLTDPQKHPALAGLPLQLDVSVPVPNFRIRDLLALEKGAIFESSWPHAEDVPVWCGGAQLVWTEFEVVDDTLAVRVTRVL
jgi:flagellar motor switch protein FliN/FliY